jgi:hypothetical protein
MTPAQIDQIARNFIGHIATSPALRVACQAVFTLNVDVDTRMALIITEAVGPDVPITPADVPAIRDRVNELFAPPPGSHPDNLGDWDFLA